MKVAIIAALALAACNGCAGWQQEVNTGLDYAHQAGVAARDSGADLVDAKCIAEAQKCIAVGITSAPECPLYMSCASAREHIAKALIALQMAILDGKAALAVGDEPGANEAVAKAIALASQIRQHLSELGLLSW